MKEFVKIDNFWWEYDTTTPPYNATLKNMGFGKMSGVDIEGLIRVQAEGFECLDWYGTRVYDNKYKSGWLSPEGKFYGCDYASHIAQAKLVHRLRECDLERDGWIKIGLAPFAYDGKTRLYEAYFAASDYTIYPTNEQIAYIRNKFDGLGKEDILYYLHRCRKMRSEAIKHRWGIEK
ncbi:MAG: hypothetical protein E7378_02085 [Clostridiales bacterium]|nr:hypothetical protein [Clostridiales bacterium]